MTFSGQGMFYFKLWGEHKEKQKKCHEVIGQNRTFTGVFSVTFFIYGESIKKQKNVMRLNPWWGAQGT